MGALWDSNMRTCDEIGMYFTVIEMVVLSIGLAFVLRWAFKKDIYNFMKLLIFLCLIADIGTAFLSIGLALETDYEFHKNNKLFVANLIGWDTLVFNTPTNLMHWLFAYKYWVISIEVPNALSKETIMRQNVRERLYLGLNIFMISINVFFCIWVSTARYQLSV